MKRYLIGVLLGCAMFSNGWANVVVVNYSSVKVNFNVGLGIYCGGTTVDAGGGGIYVPPSSVCKHSLLVLVTNMSNLKSGCSKFLNPADNWRVDVRNATMDYAGIGCIYYPQ